MSLLGTLLTKPSWFQGQLQTTLKVTTTVLLHPEMGRSKNGGSLEWWMSKIKQKEALSIETTWIPLNGFYTNILYKLR